MTHPSLAFLAAVLLTLLWATSCGPDDPVTGDPIQIELPIVAECGSIPEGPWVVTVQITRDGDIHVPGVGGPMSLLQLRDLLLRKRAQFRLGAEEGDQRTHIDLLLECDAALPWAPARWATMVAEEPAVSVLRIFFSVRHAGDGKRGAIAYFSPKPRGINHLGFAEEFPVAAVSMSDSGTGSDAPFLHEVARQYLDQGQEGLAFAVRPTGPLADSVPYAAFVNILAGLRQGGVTRLVALPIPRPLGLAAWDPAATEDWRVASLRNWVRQNRRRLAGLSIAVAVPGKHPDEARLSGRPGSRHEGAWGWTAQGSVVRDTRSVLIDDG